MDNVAASLEEKINGLTSKMGIVIMEAEDAKAKVKAVEAAVTAKVDEMSVFTGQADICAQRLEKLEVKLQQLPSVAKLEELKIGFEAISKKLKDIDNIHQTISGITEEIGDIRDSASNDLSELEKNTALHSAQLVDSVKAAINDLSLRVDKLSEASSAPSDSGTHYDSAALTAELDEKISVFKDNLENFKKETALQIKTLEEKNIAKDLVIKALQKNAEALKDEIKKLKALPPAQDGAAQADVSVDEAAVNAKAAEMKEEMEAKFQEISLQMQEAQSKMKKNHEDILAAGELIRKTARQIDDLDKKLISAPSAYHSSDRASREDSDEDNILADFEDPKPDKDLGFELNDLLQVMIKHQASDLHLKEGAPPTVRLEGELIPIGSEILSEENCKYLILSGVPKKLRRQVYEKKEVDFAYAIPEARFRVQAFIQKGTVSASYRMIKTSVPSIETLRLPSSLKNLALLNSGLILVTGESGCGKSTTLASIIDYMNANRKLHIVTLEDPIEYIHNDKLSLVTQREIGNDTLSYIGALRSSLRQDPNVIMIGEMRDSETIFTAVNAAETGHLVLTSLNSQNPIQAISRLIDVLPTEHQNNFRITLASTLKGIISQKLINRIDEDGRVPAVEFLIVNPEISSLIAENKLQDIYPLMAEGTGEGMITFAQSISELVNSNIIAKEELALYANVVSPTAQAVKEEPPAIQEDVMMSWL